uniref:Rho GTPase activating protein 8 n=1 Tax=Sphenodon punctatus TaxID=8508 RepID=A0A8D0HSI7_SPHPU
MGVRKTSLTPVAGGDPEISLNHPYYDVARHCIIQLAGDDNSGRKVITFSCCRMPPSHQLNHSRLLEYLKYTLDQYVENDYTVVYFHYGLNSRNKPSLSWLQKTPSCTEPARGCPRLTVGAAIGHGRTGSLSDIWDPDHLGL